MKGAAYIVHGSSSVHSNSLFEPFTFPKLACVGRYAETWESAEIVPNKNPRLIGTVPILSVDREYIDDRSLKGWLRQVSLSMLLQPPNGVWIA